MASDKNTWPEPHDDEELDSGDLPVKVAAGSFQEFEQWIDRELAKLVACWIHAAAPNASRPPVARARLGKHS